MRSLLLIIIPLLAVVLATGDGRSADTGPEVGKYATSFELSDLNGKKVSLSQWKGSVVLLNFWETSCGPCRAEMPSLKKLYEDLKDRGFVVLAISIDRSEKAVKSFVAAKGLPFPVLLDSEREVFFDQYAVFGLPTSFLIDRKGIIREKILGERDWSTPEIRDRIMTLLNRK